MEILNFNPKRTPENNDGKKEESNKPPKILKFPGRASQPKLQEPDDFEQRSYRDNIAQTMAKLSEAAGHDPKMFLAMSDFSRDNSVMIQKINNLQATERSLQKALEIVRGYTTDEIIAWLQDADDSSVSEKPGFYKALLSEAMKRAGKA